MKDYFEFEAIEVPDGLKAVMEENREAWEAFMNAIAPPSLRSWSERAEANDVGVADTGAWMTQVRRDQEAAFAAVSKEEAEAFGLAMRRMVLAPGFIDYMEAMKRALWDRARRRAREDDFAKALLAWFQALCESDRTKTVELIQVVCRFNAEKHNDFPQAAETFRHIEQMPDEPDDDDDDMAWLIFGRRVTQSIMDAFGDLSELRYRKYIDFMYELLTVAHPPRKPPRREPSFGSKTNSALQLMERHYPAHRDLIDPDAFKLRNGRAHVRYEADPDTGDVVVFHKDGREQMRVPLDKLSDKHDDLVNAVFDDGGWYRAMDAIVFWADEQMWPQQRAELEAALKDHAASDDLGEDKL